MKKCFFGLFAFCTISASWAQDLTVSPDTLRLGVIYENAPDSALIYVKNAGAFPVELSRVVGFPFYGDTIVKGHFASGQLNAGDSVGVWVSAAPEHNVTHTGSILVEMKNSPYGTVTIPYTFQGRYSKSYYAATENKTETALRSQLKSTTGSGYISLSYNVARDNMYATLDNDNGDVECVYTGRTATFNTRAGATSNNFNCEHTFPQGFFNSASPMKSDIHHLFPTDITSNSQRGNLPFGVVSNPSWSVGGSKKNASAFEPRNVHKGTTARAMMYFVLRYQDYAAHFSGQENLLRQWHEQYPPSAQDLARNDGIYALQNNRNPFVDYPQFSERITTLVGSSTSAPADYKLHISEDSVKLSTSASATAQLEYVVNFYNYGNRNIDLQSFSLSNNALQFVSGTGSNNTIQPGENLAVRISYPLGANNWSETLSLQSSVPGNLNISIPIVSAAGFAIRENQWEPNLKITNAEVSWPEVEEEFDWMLMDALGRSVLNGSSLNQNSVSLQSFAAGLYVLSLQSETGIYTTKIIVTKL